MFRPEMEYKPKEPKPIKGWKIWTDPKRADGSKVNRSDAADMLVHLDQQVDSKSLDSELAKALEWAGGYLEDGALDEAA